MQIGVKCPRGLILHSDCRQCALNPLHPCQYGPDVLEKMRIDYLNPDREPDSTAHTPSRILGCPRQAALQQNTDWYVDVDHAYPLTRGNMVHALMEAARYPGVVQTLREQRFKTTVDTRYGPQQFSGKCDLVVVKQFEDNVWHVNIVDYKTTSKIGHDMISAQDEHVAQINMYAWLVTKELPDVLGVRKAPVVVDTLEIEYFAMEKSRRFTSAGPLQTRGKRIPKTHPWQYETLDLLPLPFYPLEMTERAIVRRIEQRLQPTLAPILPEDERWRCERCPVHDLCYSLPEEGGLLIEDLHNRAA
jgi:hypothetical protein